MTTSPETRPVPLVVIGGTIVHRASAVRQLVGPNHARPGPARHGRRPTLADRAVRSPLDLVLRAFGWVALAVLAVKTGLAGWAAMWVGTWVIAAVFLVWSWLP